MCGIAGIYGIVGLDKAEEVVGRMTDAIAHRGPDATGIHRTSNAILGHRRLSIIDLSEASNQPFHSTDGRYTIIFNGEIYNYRELRSVLENTERPYRFRTGSDTEVLLAAYAEWGTKCLDRLQGMFAFAIWDNTTSDLFIARDRMGIKPLYYYNANGHFIFASEIRSVLASGLVPRKLDRNALVDHLRYQTVQAPSTIIAGVRMLQAGHWMLISSKGIQQERWYDLVASTSKEAAHMAPEAVYKEVKQRLSVAIERRLVADVPFGAFLSGGIDSSAIVGLMAQASSTPVHTFSVVFDEEEFSEERFARIVADRFNTKHTAIRLLPTEMLRMLPDALAAMDHPSADGPNTYVVSKVTKEAGVSMALSGTGGDEVFAGYPVFKRSLAMYEKRYLMALPKILRKGAASMMMQLKPGITSKKFGELLRADSFSVQDTYPVSRLTFSDQDLSRLLVIAELPKSSVARYMDEVIHRDGGAGLPLLSQVSLGEIGTYLQHVLLRDTDQMSMAHALEVRVPFLDHELIEFALGVPDELKYPHTPKQLLTKALADLLPDEVVNRPKMGFVMPWEVWMRNDLRAFCTERLEKLGQRSMFRKGAVLELWDQFLANDPRVNWSRLWSLVVLQDWLQRHGIEE
ncbi:MAG: asparagine synthase (glutamine-hydrolyzing) [Flavobacteriales bacterium]|nr:asparagine synthase (glutamine-hydrolyzing) [Flavobacteriales bacterium]